ncbi:MAG TPA: hypothetical protein VK658_07025 [Chryseolinea sp.]|nr:hypothetical protein [Chryseolinea sp.]
MTNELISLSTFVLSVSLATERLVAFVKTLVPWLSKEPLNAAGLINEEKERYRTLALQVIALACAFITSYLVIEAQPASSIGIKSDPPWPVWTIAVLSTAGSAFWSSVLGYANAVKDIKKQERAQQRIRLAISSQSQNIPIDKITTL